MKPIGAYTATSVVVMATIGRPSSRAASVAALQAGLAHLDVPVDVLDDDDRVVDHEADGEHQSRAGWSRLIEKPIQSIRKAPPINDSGTATAGTDRGPHRAERQVDHHEHDEHGLDEGLEHLCDRVLDELAGVVGDPEVEPLGSCVRISPSSTRAARATVRGFDPGVCSTPTKIAVLPLYQVRDS